MTNALRISCKVMAIALVAIAQLMAPAHGQNKAAKAAPKAKALTSNDFGACSAELEENFRLGVAAIRKRMAARAAVMERQRPNVSKWDQDKQAEDQRYLDLRLQQGPMELFGNSREVDESRAAATKWIKDRELENRLLRSDPGGDQIRQIVGITFTQETAAPRIAFNLAFICVMNLRLAQLDGRPIVRATPTAPSPSIADNRPVPTTPPGGALSQQQITSCSEEIKRTQIESQSWTGDVNDVAARLGRFQKDLFEGRCAGHPEAQAYIAGANKMLAYGGNAAGSGGGTQGGAQQQKAGNADANQGTSSGDLAPLRRDTKSTEHNPAHNASSCIQIFHEAEMKARGLKTIMRSIMVNNCSYPISVLWCVVGDQRGPGDCKPGYTNLANLDARGSRGIDSDYQAVQYAACRFGKDMGFQHVEKDPRYPFRFSCS